MDPVGPRTTAQSSGVLMVISAPFPLILFGWKDGFVPVRDTYIQLRADEQPAMVAQIGIFFHI